MNRHFPGWTVQPARTRQKSSRNRSRYVTQFTLGKSSSQPHSADFPMVLRRKIALLGLFGNDKSRFTCLGGYGARHHRCKAVVALCPLGRSARARRCWIAFDHPAMHLGPDLERSFALDRDPEISLWQHANVRPLELDGAGCGELARETGENLIERAKAASEQTMRVPILRRACPRPDT